MKDVETHREMLVKPLVIDSSMTNMSGTFYPTGHVFALFPDEDCVRQAATRLQTAGHSGDTAYGSPEVILQDVVRTLGGADAPLPSVGAEGDMVRRIADLASKGHHGLLIAMADNDEIDNVTAAITPEGAVAAFYYRTFIIEELVSPPLVEESTQSVVVGTHAAQ